MIFFSPCRTLDSSLFYIFPRVINYVSNIKVVIEENKMLSHIQ